MARTKELSYTQLKKECDPAIFKFKTTKELDSFTGVIGQSRGIKALEFGVNIDIKGYNIYMEGPTGIGKTYLLLYCLKSYYKINNVPANNPVILEKDGHKDLIYYSDFNVTERTILEEPTRLNLAKMMAIHECVSKHFKKDDVSIDVNKYIESNRT